MAKRTTNQHPLRAKLIFNAISGQPQESPQQLVDIVTEMQNQHILPEVFMVGQDSPVEDEVRSSIRKGIKLVVVAGGDGTIDSVAGALVGSSATLGIIPTGTRNNVAFNLGIPDNIADAVALLRQGRRLKIDVGYVRSGQTNRWFVEAATLGLLSDLYPVADDIQHGELAKIGDLLAKFISSTPSHVRMVLDWDNEIEANAYMVLIANMPYLGPRFQIDPHISWNDNRLDVFVFSDMSKLDLISYAMQSTSGSVEDDRIKHFRIKRLAIYSDPVMPVLADGAILDQGDVMAMVRPRTLAVMAGDPSSAVGELPVSSPATEHEGAFHE